MATQYLDKQYYSHPLKYSIFMYVGIMNIMHRCTNYLSTTPSKAIAHNIQREPQNGHLIIISVNLFGMLQFYYFIL